MAATAFAEPSLPASLVAVERALALAPHDGRALRRRCSLLAHLDRAEAVEACDAAVRASPGDPFVLADRANVRRLAGELDAARSDLDRAIALRGDDPTFFVSRSYVLDALGMADAARRDRARACELGRDDACENGAPR